MLETCIPSLSLSLHTICMLSTLKFEFRCTGERANGDGAGRRDFPPAWLFMLKQFKHCFRFISSLLSSPLGVATGRGHHAMAL